MKMLSILSIILIFSSAVWFVFSFTAAYSAWYNSIWIFRGALFAALCLAIVRRRSVLGVICILLSSIGLLLTMAFK